MAAMVRAVMGTGEDTTPWATSPSPIITEPMIEMAPPVTSGA